MKRTRYLVLATLIAVLVNFSNFPIVSLAHEHVHTGLPATPTHLALDPGRFSTFIQADTLYRQGDQNGAEQLYRQVKPAFVEHPITQPPEAIYDVNSLAAANLTAWNTAQPAIENGDNASVIAALQPLVNDQPGFIPGILQLAESLKADGREDEAIELLNQAAANYPSSAEVVMAQAITLADAGEHIEASIAAREFSVLYLDHPQAHEFAELADEELDTFSDNIKKQNIIDGIINIGVGIIFGDRIPWGSWDEAVETYELVDLMLSNEKKFGKKVANQYKEQLTLIDNPDVVDYVTQLGLEVARLMGRDFDYEFYVVQDNAMNAFALPGGKIFVNTGAILGTNSQAELAGVLAHEAAHAVLSHGVQGFFRDDLLSKLGEEIPLGEFITNIVSTHYSRKQEKQSDILGTRVLAKAGYAADGLRNFMATLDQQSEGGLADFDYFSTHPASSRRVTYLEELIQQNGYNRYALEGVDRHSEIQQLLG